MRLFNFATLFR